MVIHSVTPMELLLPENPIPSMTCQVFNGGFLEGYEGPQGFTIARVISTDPAVYLKKEFSPGELYHTAPNPQAPTCSN